MEQAQERLRRQLAVLEKALQTLKEALREPLTALVRDAVIQRFEYVFELSWKVMQGAARYSGVSCNSPREAIKVAFKMGWISDPDGWLEMMEARNMTSHTYNEKLAREVCNVAVKAPSLGEQLIVSLKQLVQ